MFLLLIFRKTKVIMKPKIEPSNFSLGSKTKVIFTSQRALITVAPTSFRGTCRIRISLISSLGGDHSGHNPPFPQRSGHRHSSSVSFLVGYSPGKLSKGKWALVWWPVQTMTPSKTFTSFFPSDSVTTSHWPEVEKSGCFFTLHTVVWKEKW